MSEEKGTRWDGVTPVTKEEIWHDPDSYSAYYDKALEYWEKVPTTVEGVMGGFGSYSGIDIAGSKNFLQKCLYELKLSKKKRPHTYSLDCGAGVGRVTTELLKLFISEVHLLEVAQPLLEQAKKNVGSYPSEYFCESMHTFEPTISYDLIWCQWVLGHLTDEDLVKFFTKMGNALSPSGFIVVKENVCRVGKFIFDEEDSSITRSKEEFERLFSESGLIVVVQSKQTRWPANLFPVIMWALRKAT